LSYSRFVDPHFHVYSYHVPVGGCDGILFPTLSEKLRELYEAIASVAAKVREDFTAPGRLSLKPNNKKDGLPLLLLPLFSRRPCLENVGRWLKDTG
ncbi:unnamed protein product, partial [Brassica oleracea var. botrytis]